jgi:hypothetical protein
MDRNRKLSSRVRMEAGGSAAGSGWKGLEAEGSATGYNEEAVQQGQEDVQQGISHLSVFPLSVSAPLTVSLPVLVPDRAESCSCSLQSTESIEG